MPSGVVHDLVDSSFAPPSSSRGNCLATQSQASYHSASSSPSARRPSSGLDGVNEEANVRANAAVVHGHADVRASAVMTDHNNDDVDDSNFNDTLSEMQARLLSVTLSAVILSLALVQVQSGGWQSFAGF